MVRGTGPWDGAAGGGRRGLQALRTVWGSRPFSGIARTLHSLSETSPGATDFSGNAGLGQGLRDGVRVPGRPLAAGGTPRPCPRLQGGSRSSPSPGREHPQSAAQPLAGAPRGLPAAVCRAGGSGRWVPVGEGQPPRGDRRPQLCARPRQGSRGPLVTDLWGRSRPGVGEPRPQPPQLAALSPTVRQPQG